jgi:hypothetical protein
MGIAILLPILAEGARARATVEAAARVTFPPLPSTREWEAGAQPF